ncbi:MAG: hypothetical protein GC137_04505 [Alphaproteobacteria bacterium]|nr:hypothetical protein [Alphaproteobacteria bacterium]
MIPFKKNTGFLIGSILVVAAIAGVLAYQGFKSYQKEQRLEQERQEKLELQEKQEKYAKIQVLFNRYLNDFKADLEGSVFTYKKNYAVLKQVFSAYNFETSDYAKETHRVFHVDIMPALQKQADSTLNIFKKYEERIQDELKKDMPDDEFGEIQKLFYERWSQMNKEQLENYTDYFERQEKILNAYSELMNFYLKTVNYYDVDLEKNIFVFKREEDRQKEQTLKAKIEELK